MAGRSHAAGYRMVNTVFGEGLPPIRLAAVADANTALAEDGARRYGYEKALPSWEAVAEDPSIDAVSIVVGNALHRPIAEALVAAGKHVLCEKPLAGSMEDGRAMVELERTADVVTAVGYTFRRSPAIAAIRDHVRNGELGEMTLFNGRYWCDYACDPGGPLSWRFRGAPGSGALGDIGAHVIDVAEYICGPIVSVSGGALSTQIPKRPLPLGAVVGHGAAPVSSEVGEVENEDTAMFSARFASGLEASFSVSRTAFGMPNGLAFDVYGLGGRASFDWHRPAEYLFDDTQPEARTRGVRQVIVGPADALLPRWLPDGGPWCRHRQPGRLHLPMPGLPRPDRRHARSPARQRHVRRRPAHHGDHRGDRAVGAVRRRRGSGRRRRRRRRRRRIG